MGGCFSCVINADRCIAVSSTDGRLVRCSHSAVNAVRYCLSGFLAYFLWWQITQIFSTYFDLVLWACHIEWLDVACFSVTPILTPFVYQTSAWSWYGASCCKREHTFSFYWYILLWLAAATLTHCGACKSHSNHNYVAYRPSIDLQFLSQSKYCCFICFFYSYSLSKFLSAPWLCAVGLPT